MEVMYLFQIKANRVYSHLCMRERNFSNVRPISIVLAHPVFGVAHSLMSPMILDGVCVENDARKKVSMNEYDSSTKRYVK